LKFDSVAKLAECADHSDSADSLGLFAHRRASLLISDAFMQNHPDQLTDAMRNRPDGFVVAETRNETTVDDLEDASFTFDGSIGSLIEKAITLTFRRVEHNAIKQEVSETEQNEHAALWLELKEDSHRTVNSKK
jgi:hypothetical protein